MRCNPDDRFSITPQGRRALLAARRREQLQKALAERDQAEKADPCCTCDSDNCVCPPSGGVNPARNLYEIADAIADYLNGGGHDQ